MRRVCAAFRSLLPMAGSKKLLRVDFARRVELRLQESAGRAAPSSHARDWSYAEDPRYYYYAVVLLFYTCYECQLICNRFIIANGIIIVMVTISVIALVMVIIPIMTIAIIIRIVRKGGQRRRAAEGKKQGEGGWHYDSQTGW